LYSHDPPDGPRNDAPGAVCRRRLGGRQVNLVWPAWEKRIKDPDAWYAEALKAVRDPKTDLRRRLALVSFLGDGIDSNANAQSVLKELLVRDPAAAIRAGCAEALQEAVSTDATVARLLLDRLDKDQSDAVRASCAEALRSVVPSRGDVRGRLEGLFTSGPEAVRVGAVRGLSRLDFTSSDQESLRDRLLAAVASPIEPKAVRCASIWALAPLVGRDDMPAVNRVLEDRLDDSDSSVRKAALHVLADAIAEGRREWSQPLVDRIEKMLMATTDPCPHFLWDLTAIVALKEARGGHRLERLLGDALNPFADLIRIAFVFGSVARLEQIQESDIDLMVVGDVRLKELAAALYTAEQVLGRAVNPVLFSAEKFRQQYREGNPFLLDVVRKQKIFLKGGRDELRALVGDEEAG
jgi:predicted nucleotidyltransferase